MKENIDIMSAVAGGVGALIKGKKAKRKLKTLAIDALVGAILGYTTIGVLDMVLDGATNKVIMLVSFSVGWVANEITDILEKLVNDGYNFLSNKLKGDGNSNKEV